jgi:hypothetical protein
MIHTAPCVMFLMRADKLGGEVGGWGWRWKSRVLWAPREIARADRSRVRIGLVIFYSTFKGWLFYVDQVHRRN